LVGFLFFIATQTYPTLFLLVLTWFSLILVTSLVQKLRDKQWSFSAPQLSKGLGLVLAFLIPVAFSIPYLYRYYLNSISGVRFDIPIMPVSSFWGEFVKAKIGFNWLLDLPSLSHFFSEFGQLLSLGALSLILLVVFFIPRIPSRINIGKDFRHGLLLVYLFFLLIMCYLTLTLFLPINLLSNIFDPARVWQHIFIPVTIMTAVILFFAVYFSHYIYSLFRRPEIKLIKKLSVAILLLTLIFSIGFISVPIFDEQRDKYDYIRTSLNTYTSLNHEDVLLMEWIDRNIASDARILVSSGDSGQFVSSVTHRQTVSMYSTLNNYTDLMELLTSDASDLDAVALLTEYDISHIYVGSIGLTYSDEFHYRQFNVTQLLSSPHFMLKKQLGDAWLFEFN
jgi:hypothetical protein